MFLPANEVISWLKKKKRKGALFKVNFRTYDFIRWSFLEHMLIQMGFGVRSRRWIMWCVSKAHISITVNGSPCELFKMHRGIRRGTYFSFLFSIVGEVLTHFINETKRQELIQAIKAGRDKVELTHLQCSLQMTLLFLPNHTQTVVNLKLLIHYFSLMTGLEVNFSEIMCSILKPKG